MAFDRKKTYKIIQKKKTFVHAHNHQRQEPSEEISKILPTSSPNITQLQIKLQIYIKRSNRGV
jgi:hypothetical protein